MAIAQNRITVANRLKDDYDLRGKDTSFHPNERENHHAHEKRVWAADKDPQGVKGKVAIGNKSPIHTTTTTAAAAADDDVFDEILSLKLRKPKHWKWELSTSQSSARLLLPRILLYDHKGHLLADVRTAASGVQQQWQIYRESDDNNDKNDHNDDHHHYGPQQMAATIDPRPPQPRLSYDFHINELADYMQTLNASTTTTTTNSTTTTTPSTATTSSSRRGFRRRIHRHRRSSSQATSTTHSPSILERLSFRKGRFSSPETSPEDLIRGIDGGGEANTCMAAYMVEETDITDGQYFLRSSKAGTLVVKQDSFFRHPQRRRRPTTRRVSSTNGQRLVVVPLQEHDLQPNMAQELLINRRQEKEEEEGDDNAEVVVNRCCKEINFPNRKKT